MPDWSPPVGTVSLNLVGTPGSFNLDIGTLEQGNDRVGTLAVRTGSVLVSAAVACDPLVTGPLAVRTVGPSVSGTVSPVSQFAPILMFKGITFSGTALTIPAGLFSILSADEINATTGDWRKIVQALLLHANEYLAAQHAVDVPQTVWVSLLEDMNCPHAVLGSTLRRTISPKFNVVFPAGHIADEPE